jgi:hypothetical protein
MFEIGIFINNKIIDYELFIKCVNTSVQILNFSSNHINLKRVGFVWDTTG